MEKATSANEWLDSLPEQPGPDRDEKILNAVQTGLLYCNWVEVTTSIPEYNAIFYVCDDALRLDLEDGSRFRPQVSATLAQKCADLYGASLPTSKVCDLAYLQATVRLSATLLPASGEMVTTKYSKLYNSALEQKRAGRVGLIRDVGKAWIISNKILTVNIPPNTACNYGYYDSKAPYSATDPKIKLWQTRGTRHNRLHQDFSQTLILMADYCKINEEIHKVTEVMSSSILCSLISDEGVLKITRQPGV